MFLAVNQSSISAETQKLTQANVLLGLLKIVFRELVALIR